MSAPAPTNTDDSHVTVGIEQHVAQLKELGGSISDADLGQQHSNVVPQQLQQQDSPVSTLPRPRARKHLQQQPPKLGGDPTRFGQWNNILMSFAFHNSFMDAFTTDHQVSLARLDKNGMLSSNRYLHILGFTCKGIDTESDAWQSLMVASADETYASTVSPYNSPSETHKALKSHNESASEDEIGRLHRKLTISK